MRCRDLFAFTLLAVPACAAGHKPDTTGTTSSDITTAVPKAEWIDIQTGSTMPLDTTTSPSMPPPPTCQGGPPAMFAAMSAQIMGGSNGVLGGVLGTVQAITQSPPAAMTQDHAVWGPLVAPNDPIVHKLDIQRVADNTFHFVLSGKPIPADDSAWVGMFQGDITTPDAQHAAGDVEIDFGAIHALDPSSNPVAGAIAIHFAAAPDSRAIDETFAGIAGQMAPQPNNAHYAFAQDGTGTRFEFVTQADFDHDGVADELLDVQALFAPDGSGKASTTVTGGALGTNSVSAIECWDNQQRVLFYADSTNTNPPAGNPACCTM